MGNSPSSEQPRKAPQKLSKARVGRHASSNNLLNPNGLSPTADACFSNPYLDGSSPVPSSVSTNASPTPGQAVAGEDIRSGSEGGARSDIQQRLGLVRSPTLPLQREPVSRRSSAGLATAKTFDGVNRPKSTVQHGDLAPLSSVTSLGGHASRRASCLDLGSHGAHRAASVTPENINDTSPVLSETQIEAQDALVASQQPHAIDTLSSRTQSEASLYAPSRRRSAILPPGVATRAEPSEGTLMNKSSFRKSIPETPTESRAELGAEQHFPLSPGLSMPDTPERLATPSDGEYKQLGGIKFGSLRITNGTPVSSVGPEPDQKNDATAPASDDPASDDMMPIPVGTSRDNSLTSSGGDVAGEIKQPRPVSAAVSPVVATFNDAPTSGLGSSNDSYSPFSPPGGAWKSDGVSPLSPATQPSEYEDARESPDADMSPRMTALDELQQSAGDVARSHSGSGSASSSGNEQLSKADSGYGSSISLQSMLGSKEKTNQTQENMSSQEASTTGRAQEKRPPLKQQIPYQPTAGNSEAVSPQTGVSPSNSPLAEEGDATCQDQSATVTRGGSLLSSLRARKFKTGDRQTEKPYHARGSSISDAPIKDASTEKPTSSSGASTGRNKPTKFQKIIKNARRRSLPNMLPSEGHQENMPSMPLDAERKLREHNHNLEVGSKRHSGRFRLKKESNTGGQAKGNEIDKPAAVDAGAARRDNDLEPTSRIHLQKSRTISAASAKPQSNRRSILRKSRQVKAEPDDLDGEDMPPDYVLGHEAQVASIDSIRRSVGNSAFDAAFVPMAEDNAIETVLGRKPLPGPPRIPDGPGPYPRLRTRSSAPDFLETVSEPASPGGVDCYSQRKPKTPPPVSIRTRGSKKTRRSKSHRSPAHDGTPLQRPPKPIPCGADDDGLQTEPSLSQSLRSFPVQGPNPMGPQQVQDPRNQTEHGIASGQRLFSRPLHPSPMQRSEPRMGRLPPLPRSRDAAASINSQDLPRSYRIDDAQRPPGRVLHSYNSPAYKGVPIWG